MNRLLSSMCLGVLPVLAWAQAVPPAMPAPTTNLPPPQAAPTTNLPPPMAAPNPLVVPVAPMYLNASQTFIYRGSTATYFDSAGTLQVAPANTPRYDYDPITHAAKGILVEPRRTNIIPNSSSFSNWASGTLVVSATAAPDGTSSAAHFYAVSGYMIFNTDRYKIHIPPNRQYTFSIWLKSATGSNQTVPMFIEDNGTQSNRLMARVDANVTTVWQRFSVTGYSDTPSYIFRAGPRTGDYYVWGPQLELGSSTSSYIPTTGTAITRAQDVYQQF